MSKEYRTFKEAIDALVKWTVERLERTPFAAFKFTFPKQYISPFGYLGTLTAIVFLILGITGAILMFYYTPSIETAYASVKEIQDSVPFGFEMRQIHYHASNFMVLLAVMHLYYQYFSGRYKIKNEVLWVTGIILGILTVLEAYTGYNLILNQRAMLAINIGMGLTFSAPVLGPSIAPILHGRGILRPGRPFLRPPRLHHTAADDAALGRPHTEGPDHRHADDPRCHRHHFRSSWHVPRRARPQVRPD
jgi:ubiquinol-cytochrome c reductase cytochrome b subunit